MVFGSDAPVELVAKDTVVFEAVALARHRTWDADS